MFITFSSLEIKNHNNEDDEKREIEDFIKHSVEIIDESILIGYGIMYTSNWKFLSINGKGIALNRKITIKRNGIDNFKIN